MKGRTVNWGIETAVQIEDGSLYHQEERRIVICDYIGSIVQRERKSFVIEKKRWYKL